MPAKACARGVGLPTVTFVLGLLLGLAGNLHTLLLPSAPALGGGGAGGRLRKLAAAVLPAAVVTAAPTAASPATAATAPGGRNLVICLADGVEYEGAAGIRWLARFAGSFRRHDADAKLVFLTTNVSDSIAPWLEAYDLTPVVFGDDVPAPWAQMEVAARRWWLIRRYLEQHAGEHAGGGWVAAVDARDLWFQRSPFDWPRAPGDGLYVFYEQQDEVGAIKDHSWNRDVVAACYNKSEPAVAAAMAHPVSCSGTVMGSFAAMSTYVRLMSQEMADRSTDAKCMATGGRDQGFHNMLLHSGALAAAGLRVTAFSNEEGGLVRTLGRGELFMDLTGRVLSDRGEVVAMVHQWDRSPDIFRIVDDVLFPALKPEMQVVNLPPEFPARRRDRAAMAADALARGRAQAAGIEPDTRPRPRSPSRSPLPRPSRTWSLRPRRQTRASPSPTRTPEAAPAAAAAAAAPA